MSKATKSLSSTEVVNGTSKLVKVCKSDKQMATQNWQGQYCRMLRMKDLTIYCALSSTFIYDQIRDGSFPKGHKLSIGITAWEKSEVDAWLDQRKRGV